MEYVIIYFSGTGNTELISDEIARRLRSKNHSVQLISIEDVHQLNNIDFENKIIGFGYPVYKFSYPDNFDKILPQLSQLVLKNDYFQFSTYARFDAQAFYDFSMRLDKNTFRLIAQASFKSPSCGISARKSEDDYEYKSVMFFENHISDRLDEFVDSIINRNEIIIKKKYQPFNNLKMKIVNNIEITKYPKLSIDRSQCVTCGLCSKKCPDSNLEITDDHIHISDEVGCLHCLRCMNHCPSNAITFGSLTEGDNQYTKKVRNLLYKKSTDGYLEKYWDDFGAVVKKWRRATIKYWITHR